MGGKRERQEISRTLSSLASKTSREVAGNARGSETTLLSPVSAHWPTQASTLDARGRCTNHGEGPTDRSQAKQSARPLSPGDPTTPRATFSLVATGPVIGSREGPRPINEGVSPLPQTRDLATFLVLLASLSEKQSDAKGVCRDQSD